MAARAGLGDGIQGQRCGRDLERAQVLRHHLQQLGVDDQLLERCGQPAFEPACRMHDQVGAAADRGPQRQRALVRGLRVHGVGRRHAAGPVRQAVAPGELAAGLGGFGIFGRPERRRTETHVDVGSEGAVDDRSARAHDLRQRDAGQGLGILLRQGAGQRDRGHGPGQGERRDADGLARRRQLDQAIGHRHVQLQRRVRVDDAAQGRPCRQFFG